ncbi:MAG: CHAD domain-containing protein [Rhizobiaceae bacterium]|nr:CHAD domain-containing protein [Rhizobiaceae bacterium]MCV0405791.1 CHAD domain-containing protein [Rhizobiaceae bacterium]
MSARLHPGHGLPAEFRRVARSEVGRAVDLLTDPSLPRGKVLHETRKRLKKVRAALALVRSADEDFYKRENARYRDMARAIAGAREASALIETLDRFERDFPDPTSGDALGPLRRILTARRDAALAEDTALDEAIANAVRDCGEGLDRLDAFRPGGSVEHDAAIPAEGAAATVKKARKAIASAAQGGHAEDFHDLRKAVKRHWTQLEHIGDLWPGAVAPRRRALKDLGELLGELNDIAVMRERLRAMVATDETGAAIALMRKLMARKEKSLRRRSLDRATRLFAMRPKAVRKAIDAAWRAAADRPAPARDARRALALAG